MSKSKARKALEERIKKAQEKNPLGTYEGQIDALDDLLVAEISQVQEMRRYLGEYPGDHPILLRYKQKLLGNPSWIPTSRERTVFFGIVSRLNHEGVFREPGSLFPVPDPEDDGPTSLDP